MIKSKNKILICSAALIINLILFFVKIYVAMASNSISIYVDSLNSLADTAVCLLAVVGFRVSCIKADERFPFGYGKIEELIDFIISIVILFTGLSLAYSSLQRLMYPVAVWFSLKYAVVIACTALVKLVMAFGYKRLNQRINSSVIKSLSVDSVLDFFVSACIVASFTLTTVFGYAIDSVMGITASVVIIVNGIKSITLICTKLIGKKDSELCKRASEILLSDNRVLSVTSCECHIYGENVIFNAEIKADLQSAKEVSELLEDLKSDIKQQLNALLFITYGG